MVRALVVVFVPQVLPVRKISVADSYCNAFYFVLFFCIRLFVRSWACVLFRCSVVISVMLSLVWLLFVPGCRFRAFACAMGVAVICL